MTKLQERLVNAYTVLVMAGRKTLEEVPATEVTLVDGTLSTIRQEVEVLKAEREIAILS